MGDWPDARKLHLNVHLWLHLRDDSEFDFPAPGTTSILATSGHRPSNYPRAHVTAALDGRQAMEELMDRLYDDALPLLREYNELMYRALVRVCIEGAVTFLPNARGRSLRHVGKNFEKALELYFDDNDRTALNWMVRAWDLIWAALSPAQEVRLALVRRTVWRPAVEWLSERGAIDD